MKSVRVSHIFDNIPLDEAWRLLTDIDGYPDRVKYVKEVRVGEFLEGSKWDNVMTILWIPLKFSHKNLTIVKNKEFSFCVSFLGKVFMKEKYTLVKNNHRITVSGIVEFDLGNTFLNLSLGNLLVYRIKDMLTTSFANIEREKTAL